MAGPLLAALTLSFIGLVHVTQRLAHLREGQLASLDAEEEIYRAAWEIEVTVRHARTQCARGEVPEAFGAKLAGTRAELAELATHHPAEANLRSATERYVALADELASDPTCEHLLSAVLDSRRNALDEDLTNVWGERRRELHAILEAEEDAARAESGALAMASLGIAVAACVAMAWVIRATARRVTLPLGRLAVAARRVGDGDFAPVPELGDTLEVRDLGRELERMRVRLLELDQLKQGFVASVSHEMRSPLTRIREALALLGDGTTGPLSATQARVVQLARAACEQEVRIVTTLLDVSRLRAGSLKRAETTSIDAVLKTAIEEELYAAEQRGVSLGLDAASDVPRVQVDPSLVERAVANLVRNAVSVSERGERVEVGRSVESREGAPWMRVTVRDHGPGVPRSLRERLFEPFASAAVPARERGAGVGLGLTMAREVARAHGGDLELAEDEGNGVGATFFLWLPLGTTRRTA